MYGRRTDGTGPLTGANEYDRDRGMSFWTKNYRTSIESTDESALSRTFVYYDPIDTLPESGQDWWRKEAARDSAA